MTQIWKEARVDTRAPASTESSTTCLWACAPSTPRCEQLMAYVSGPSGKSCIEMFRFRTSFAPHSYVNGLFLTRQSEPNTCVIYQQTYYVGIKEVHSEPTSAECDRLLCFHLSNRCFLSVYHSFSLPTLFCYQSTVSFKIYKQRWREGNLTR